MQRQGTASLGKPLSKKTFVFNRWFAVVSYFGYCKFGIYLEFEEFVIC